MRTWLAIAAVYLAGFVGGHPLLAQAGKTARTVQDDLGLFSAEAKAKANAEIARIKQSFHKDLVIETTSPPNKPAGLDENDKAAMKRFFDRWAAERFKNEQIDGVYVLLLEKPHIVRVLVGPKTAETGLFTSRNTDELDQKIIEKMKAGDKDGALLTATSFVADTMRHNGQARVGAAPPGNAPRIEHPVNQEPANQPQISPIMKYILIGLGILLVFWIISAIIRGFSTMRGGYAGGGPGAGGGYGPGYGGGGGGFMNGFLGGLLGGAAGMWAYNHFFGPSTPSAWGGEHQPGGGYAQNEPTDVGAGEPYVAGGDYSEPDKGAVEEPGDAGDAGGGGGGDWGGGGGDAGGGGDWGGGGGGGGGGGDWGGGGGGGDW